MSENPSSAAPAKPRYKRRLSNFLLDKSLQLRYVAFITALSAVIAGTLGFLIWKQENRASKAIVQTLDSSELADYPPDLKAQIVDRLTTYDDDLVLIMVVVGIGLALVLSLYVVVLTHKVAGPLYKVSLYFDRWKQGRLGEVHGLRKGDMLVDFYDNFKGTHEAVRARVRQDNDMFGRFLDACEAAGVSGDGELGRQLEALRAHKTRRDKALA